VISLTNRNIFLIITHTERASFLIMKHHEMAGNHMKEKILVSQEAIDAYELATGFIGIGRFFEERGIWTIIQKGVPCPAQK